VADSEPTLWWHVRRFPQTVGGLLIAPGRALGDIERAERGGFSVLVIWCLAAGLALRFVNLADAVAGWNAGGGVRVVSVLVGELTQAVPAALAAALAIVVLAGAKREPAIDLELGCAAAIPFVVARAAFRAAVIVAGREPRAAWVEASYVVAAVWSVVVLGIAVRIARRRPSGRAGSPPGTAAASRQRLRAQLSGFGALAILVVGLGGGVVWTVGHTGDLGPVTRGGPAPNFSLPRVDGQTGSVSLASLHGRVVVLDFWATWCPPCIAMLPTMHELDSQFAPQGVAFLGVDSDGGQTSADEVTAFLREHGAPYPVVYDDGRANDLYRIKVLPTLVIVGKDGMIERVLMGMTTKSTLAKTIAAAVAR
jgi:thiol-disulfide isomerase/thioredoxin